MRNPKNPLVSVVIVNFNGRVHLIRCLESLSQVKKPSFETIVVDNGSQDGSLEWLAHQKKIKLVKNPTNLGFAQANNQGKRLASGKYLLFLNNDTKVTPDFLEKLVEVLEKNPQVGIVQPKIYQMGTRRLDVVGSYLTWTGFLTHLGFGEKDFGQYDTLNEIFSPKGACMLIARRLFERVGGFDNQAFAYFEETDLAWRVWLLGKTVRFVPEATIEHAVGATTRKLDFTFSQYHSNKNRIATLLKNLSPRQLSWRLAVHLGFVLFLAGVLLALGQSKKAGALLRAIGWNIRHLGQTLTLRSKVQKQHRVSDQQLLPRISRPFSPGRSWQDSLWLAKAKN